jgi:O-antigen/teichoic acid export membrane protein
MTTAQKTLPTKLTERAVGAAWWSTMEITARYFAQFVVMIVLARLLAPTDFGLVAMLAVFTSVGALLVDSGFGTALIQRQRMNADDETTVFIFTLAVSVLLATALWICAPAVADFYAQPSLVALARAMASLLPLGALGAVPDALLTMKLQFRARAKAELFASLLSGLVAITLAFRAFGAWSLVWQAISQIGARSLLLWIYSGWRPKGRFRRQAFHELFGFGGYILLSGLLETISVRMQSLLIGKLFDSHTLGLYTVAQNTQQAPTSFISSLLNRVGLPVFSTVADQPAKLLGALRISLRAALFVFVPSMIGIAIVAKPLIGLLYGQRWEGAAPVLTLLSIASAFWPVHVLNLAVLSAQGRSDLFFRLALIKKSLSIGLVILGAFEGPIGIATAVLVANLLSVVINAHYSKKFIGYGVFDQLFDQRSTLALSLAAALAGWAILHWNRPSLLATITAIAVAGLIYVGGAIVTRNPAWTELVGLSRALRGQAARQVVSETP